MAEQYVQHIEKGVELLQLCLKLQCEKNGEQKPSVHDPFYQDIQMSINYMSALHKLMPMMNNLHELGKKLDKEGKIKLEVGDDYSVEALKYVMSEYHVEMS